MLILWRKFIGWLRSICIYLFILKKPIDWNAKLKEFALIFIGFLDLSSKDSTPQKGGKIRQVFRKFKIFKRIKRLK